MPVTKRSFLKNAGIILSVRGKIPNNFINKILPIKNLESEPELTAFATPKQKKNKLRNIFIILCRF